MISKIAKFKVKQEHLDECLEAIREFVNAVKHHESDTLYYESFQEPDGVSFTHIMSFKDEEAEKYHRNTAHVNKFVNILYPNCEQKPVFIDVIQVD